MPDDESLTDAAAFGRLYQQQGASIRQFLSTPTDQYRTTS